MKGFGLMAGWSAVGGQVSVHVQRNVRSIRLYNVTDSNTICKRWSRSRLALADQHGNITCQHPNPLYLFLFRALPALRQAAPQAWPLGLLRCLLVPNLMVLL